MEIHGGFLFLFLFVRKGIFHIISCIFFSYIFLVSLIIKYKNEKLSIITDYFAALNAFEVI
jgi:hypothetical protein